MSKKQTDEFLTHIKSTIPVSDEFLEKSRVIVERMFSEVSEEHLEMCKLQMVAIFKYQAETEEILNRARDTVTKIQQDCKRITEEKEKGKISIKPVNLKPINFKSD